jgi:uncharacterized protein YlbG (UPF0298 family)
LMGKQSKSFPQVVLLMPDQVNGKAVVLQVNSYSDSRDLTKDVSKLNYVKAIDSVEKEYLGTVFSGQKSEPKYTSFDGRHELFFPVKAGSKNMVLLFSDNSSYGKFGS